MADDKKELSDPRGLWPWFRFFMLLSAVLSLVLAGGQAFEIAIGTPEINDFTDLDAATLAWLAALSIGGIGYLVVFIICAFLASRLTFRMMRNLHRMEVQGVTIGPGWAVGTYFIPIANLFQPVRAIGQMWRGTHSAAGEGEPDSAIPLWWGSWLLFNILSNVSWSMSEGAYVEGVIADPGTYQTSLYVGTASNVLGALAAIFMLQVFSPLVRLQSGLVRAQAFG